MVSQFNLGSLLGSMLGSPLGSPLRTPISWFPAWFGFPLPLSLASPTQSWFTNWITALFSIWFNLILGLLLGSDHYLVRHFVYQPNLGSPLGPLLCFLFGSPLGSPLAASALIPSISLPFILLSFARLIILIICLFFQYTIYDKVSKSSCLGNCVQFSLLALPSANRYPTKFASAVATYLPQTYPNYKSVFPLSNLQQGVNPCCLGHCS